MSIVDFLCINKIKIQMIDESQVRHVAKLARIDLNEKEINLFTGQLSKVFGYMDILNEVNVDGVEICSQVTGLTSVFENDEIVASQSTREELLDCSELEKESKQVKVLKVIK